jgi:multiple sugar transport system substrate-binding protein
MQLGSEATTLRGITWDHPRGFECLTACEPALLEVVGVNVEWEARSLLAFGDQHLREFASEFDLLVIDHPHVAEAVAAGALLPLDDWLGDDALQELRSGSVGASHDSYSYASHQWALAVDTAAQVSAWRPELVDGLPSTWDGVLEVAAEVNLLWPYAHVDCFSTFATLMAQLGHPLDPPAPGRDWVDESSADEALTLMTRLAASVPDWCASANPIQVLDALSIGDHAAAVALFGYSNYSRPGFRDRVVAFGDLQSFDGTVGGSMLGGAGIAVSSATTQPAKAAAVAAWLAGPVAQTGPYLLGGGQPGHRAAWDGAAANSLCLNFFTTTRRTLETAWVRPRMVGWPDMQRRASEVLHEAVVTRTWSPATFSDLNALWHQSLAGRLA